MPRFSTKLFRDDAVVLRVQKLGESDRIITLFARRYGRIRAVARGVRRTTSKFGGRLEPFGHVDVQIAEGRTLHSVAQVEGIDLYGRRMSDDYPRYTAASAIAETAERLTPIEGEPALPLYLLTLGALRSLATAAHAPTLVLDSYLLRAMEYAGWAPALAACAVCGTPGRHRSFSVPAGGVVCPDCSPPGAAHPSPATMELLVALAGGLWGVADVAAPGPRREASGLVAAHLQWHLERGLRSLPLVDRSTPDGPGPGRPGRQRSAPDDGGDGENDPSAGHGGGDGENDPSAGHGGGDGRDRDEQARPVRATTEREQP